MLSNDLETLLNWIGANAKSDGSLVLQPAMTGVMRFMLRDAVRLARSMEAASIAGPATITEADIASGKVERLSVVPRPVPAAPDGGGSAA